MATNKVPSTAFKPGQSGNPATRFKPGQSGNPGGRPEVMGDLREKCREMSPEVIEAMRKLALGTSSQSVAEGSLILAYVAVGRSRLRTIGSSVVWLNGRGT